MDKKLTYGEILVLEGPGLSEAFAAIVGVSTVYVDARNSSDQGEGLFIAVDKGRPMVRYSPHHDWAQAGPHLVDLGVSSRDMKNGRFEPWEAYLQVDAHPDRLFAASGTTQLEAALRVALLAVHA